MQYSAYLIVIMCFKRHKCVIFLSFFATLQHNTNKRSRIRKRQNEQLSLNPNYSHQPKQTFSKNKLSNKRVLK